MREFFKGWRRKAGLVTLAMAMVLIAGWLRSIVMTEFFSLQAGRLDYLISSNGQIVWFESQHQMAAGWTYSSSTKPPRDKLSTLAERWGVPNLNYWMIDYRPAIIPLTLLSAWLILGKPRKVKSAGVDTNRE